MKGRVTMKQIIPFEKELPFKTKVSEITSISLERDITVEKEGIVTGVFHITGDYKMNEGSINREKFSFDLPFDISLDPRYDIETVSADIEDFYYDVLNEEVLKVNIDLYVEAEYLKEKEVKEEIKQEDDTFEVETEKVVEERNSNIVSDVEEIDEKTDDEEITNMASIGFEPKINEELPINREDNKIKTEDLFSNLDDTETYTAYYVYIVKEDDTVDKILSKYDITKEELENYNDITDIKPGDKVVIPKKSE